MRLCFCQSFPRQPCSGEAGDSSMPSCDLWDSEIYLECNDSWWSIKLIFIWRKCKKPWLYCTSISDAVSLAEPSKFHGAPQSYLGSLTPILCVVVGPAWLPHKSPHRAYRFEKKIFPRRKCEYKVFSCEYTWRKSNRLTIFLYTWLTWSNKRFIKYMWHHACSWIRVREVPDVRFHVFACFHGWDLKICARTFFSDDGKLMITSAVSIHGENQAYLR